MGHEQSQLYRDFDDYCIQGNQHGGTSGGLSETCELFVGDGMGVCVEKGP